MSARCPRAEALGDRADVVRWRRRLERLVRDRPEGVSVFIAGGTGTICLLDECGDDAGERNQHVFAVVLGRGWDGGHF